MPALSLETGLDPARVGLVTGTLYASYAATLFLSGLVPFGRRAVVVAGFVLSALANVAFALARGLPAMLVLSALGGIGVGLYLPRGTATLMEVFEPGRRARALGWHELAASAGLVVAPLFMGAALLVVSWRGAVALWSLVGLGTALAVRRSMPDAPPALTAPGAAFSFDLRALALAGVGGACFAVIAGFFTMLPTVAAGAWGLAPPAAAAFAGWTRTGGLAGALLGGPVADRLGRLPGLLGCYVVTLGALGALPFLPYGPVLGFLVFVAALSGSAAGTAYYALLGDAYRPEERERVYGPIQATAALIGSTATPVVLGFALDRLSARAALAVMAAAPLVGTASLALYMLVAARSRQP
jgi:MFS family permease